MIGMHLVDRYIEAFYPDGTGARGRLIIRARRRGQALELGKLLYLHAASPSLRVGISSFSSLPGRLLPKDRSSAWLVYATKSVSRLTFVNSMDGQSNHSLHISVSREACALIAHDWNAEMRARHWQKMAHFPTHSKGNTVTINVYEARLSEKWWNKILNCFHELKRRSTEHSRMGKNLTKSKVE